MVNINKDGAVDNNNTYGMYGMNNGNSPSTNTNNINTVNTGISGLGNIDLQAGILGEQVIVNDNRLLILDGKNISADNYFNYLRDWFKATGVFDIHETNVKITSVLGFNKIFDISFKGEQVTHAVIACYDIDTAQKFIARCANGKFSDPALLFAFYNFNKYDMDIALKCNIELIGINEMININNSITSAFGGIGMGMKFTDKVMKALNAKYRPMELVNNDIQGTINDGVAQLKESLISAFEAIGLTALIKKYTNTPQANANNNINSPSRFGESFGAGQTMQTEQVGQAMQNNQSIFGEQYQAVQQEESYTTIDPNAYKSAVVDNASDFLKITPQVHQNMNNSQSLQGQFETTVESMQSMQTEQSITGNTSGVNLGKSPITLEKGTVGQTSVVNSGIQNKVTLDK